MKVVDNTPLGDEEEEEARSRLELIVPTCDPPAFSLSELCCVHIHGGCGGGPLIDAAELSFPTNSSE